MGSGYDIGEVHLALGVVRVEVVEGFAQEGDVEHVGGGADLADLALGVGGVSMFDDPDDVARLIAHDTPVSGGVVDDGR